MALDHYTVENYFQKELKFWKTLRHVFLQKPAQDKVLAGRLKQVKREKTLRLAEKRFKNMTCLIRLFERRHLVRIAELVNKRLDSGFSTDDLCNLKALKKWKQPEVKGASRLAFGFVEVVIAIVVAVIVTAAESSDDDVTIEVVGPYVIDLIAADARLTCEELATLDYAAWTTYLLLMQAKNDTSNYVLALVCGACENLKTLGQLTFYDWGTLLPDDITWVGAFLVAAKLEECGIPY